MDNFEKLDEPVISSSGCKRKIKTETFLQKLAKAARFKLFCSVRDFRPQSANHLIQFRSSESRAQIIWFSSGLQSPERDSFGSVRDLRA